MLVPIKDVLVVEDDVVLGRIYQSQLNRLQLNFDIVNSGYAALNQLKKYQYHLIIIDFGLPDINGAVICQKIRRLASLGHTKIPIIMFSASGNIVKPKCLSAGATSFYTKTVITTPKFAEIIEEFLST